VNTGWIGDRTIWVYIGKDGERLVILLGGRPIKKKKKDRQGRSHLGRIQRTKSQTEKEIDGG